VTTARLNHEGREEESLHHKVAKKSPDIVGWKTTKGTTFTKIKSQHSFYSPCSSWLTLISARLTIRAIFFALFVAKLQ